MFPEFVVHAPWWTVQYHEKNGDDDTVWLWVSKDENRAYERGEAYRKRHIVHERRWCDARIKITELQRGKSYWFSIKAYFTVVSSIHSVLQAYPGRKISYERLRKGNESGVLVRRTQ